MMLLLSDGSSPQNLGKPLKEIDLDFPKIRFWVPDSSLGMAYFGIQNYKIQFSVNNRNESRE